MAQEVYAAEGIEVPKSAFKDNQPTLDLLDKKATGVFSMLDDEISVPKGSDASFLSKVIKVHEKHPNFSKATIKNCPNRNLLEVAFGVKHVSTRLVPLDSRRAVRWRSHVQHDTLP